jgi:hypothetical protein
MGGVEVMAMMVTMMLGLDWGHLSQTHPRKLALENGRPVRARENRRGGTEAGGEKGNIHGGEWVVRWHHTATKAKMQ